METPVLKRRACCRWSCWLLTVLALQLTARADQIIYDDALENGWQNWSWATVNLANTSPVHSGSDSISVTANNNPTNWQALYLDVTAMNTSGFTNLAFWINGGTGGQAVLVQGNLGGTAQTPGVQIGPLPTNSWRQVTLSMSALGVANQANFTGFWLQAQGSSTVPTFYVDDISLVTNAVVSGTNAPESNQPLDLRRGVRNIESAGGFEFHHEPVGRKQRDVLQLADQCA